MAQRDCHCCCKWALCDQTLSQLVVASQKAWQDGHCKLAAVQLIVSGTCSSGLLDRVMAAGSTLSVTRPLCCGWRCSKVVQKVKLRAAMSRSVSFTNGATSSTAAFKVPGWMLLPCPAINTCTSKVTVGSRAKAKSWRVGNGVQLCRLGKCCFQGRMPAACRHC